MKSIVLFCALCLATTSGFAKSLPNIVVIFVDDMGYGDIGPFGNRKNKTPNLDRMASEGNVLRQFYVSSTACTPSRSALLTGAYAHRIGMDGDVLFPGERRGLNPSEMTIAEMLKAQGYATGCFGKWHLGDQPEFLPLAQGFDEYVGIPYSNDMWPGNTKGHRYRKEPYTPLPVLRQNDVVAYVSDGEDQALLGHLATEAAVSFIESHKDSSFFCYVPHALVHRPRFARPEMLKKADGDVVRATVEEIDAGVGRILGTLRQLNLEENTLVLFTSDNGGAGGMSMGPLRGGKGGPKYEGHMRVPTITWWPGTIPAGAVTNQIAATIDLLPSLAKLTDAHLDNSRLIDGKDALDILLAKPNAVSPHPVLYYENDAIRRGPWKLVHTPKGRQLFNLDEDLGEKKNVAERHPKIVAELEELLASHAKSVAANTRPAGKARASTTQPLIQEPGNLPRLREYLKVRVSSSKTSHQSLSTTVRIQQVKSIHKTPRPNIVVILADDQGWNGLSVPMDPNNPASGSTYFRTPNLAQLASEGMRFSRAYSPGPTCSPSRHAIQFGRSPTNLHIYSGDGIQAKQIDATAEQSMANCIKQVAPDYICAHMGKWHIAFPPDKLGYDVVATGDGHDLNAKGYKARHNPQSRDPQDPKFIFSLTRQANAFIEQQATANRPFYLQISHYADHLKYAALAQTVDKYKTEHAGEATPYHNDPLWAAMNENLDTGVGMVLETIDRLGLADNTYVIYTADNGFEDKHDFGEPIDERGYYKAYPQRSHKYHLSEGGIRVPFIVRGPGIPAGAYSPDTVVGTDIFPTVMDILGKMDQVPKKVEGGSLLAHLHSGGKAKIARRDPYLVFKFSKPRAPFDGAIVEGDYKLISDLGSEQSFLYNLKEDISERNDLSAQKPERAKAMHAHMVDYLEQNGWRRSMINRKVK